MSVSKTIESKVYELLEPNNLNIKTEVLNLSLGSDELLIETVYSGISPGTEISALRGLSPLRPGKAYPRVLGYCNVGKVIDKSNDDNEYCIGDLVLTHTSHRSHAVVRKRDILARIIDDELSLSKSLAYLYIVAEAGLNRPSRKIQNAAVVGLGLLGLMSVELLLHSKIPVVAISDHESANDMVRKMGADCYRRTEILDQLECEKPLSVERVILYSNKWVDWELSLNLAARFGQIAVAGFPGRGEELPGFNILDPQRFYHKQLTICSVGQIAGDEDTRSSILRENLKKIIYHIEKKNLVPERFILGTMHWSELKSAYDCLMNKNRKPGTFILSWKN